MVKSLQEPSKREKHQSLPGREEGKEDPKMWCYTNELVKRFREEIVESHGDIRCREIIGVGRSDREQVANYFKGGEKYWERAHIIGDAAKLTGELLSGGHRDAKRHWRWRKERKSVISCQKASFA
jgi:hypothetical protein